MNGSKIVAFGQAFWSLFAEKNLTVKNFLFCREFPWSNKKFLWKISLAVEKFLDCVKIPWPSKISFTVENFLDYGKIPWLWKNSLTVEKFFDYGKLTFFTVKKIIGLIILKTNANVEIINRYILNLEQKLSSLAFFVVDKINIISSRRLKHKY